MTRFTIEVRDRYIYAQSNGQFSDAETREMFEALKAAAAGHTRAAVIDARAASTSMTAEGVHALGQSTDITRGPFDRLAIVHSGTFPFLDLFLSSAWNAELTGFVTTRDLDEAIRWVTA